MGNAAPPPSQSGAVSSLLEQTAFPDISGWDHDDHRAALMAFAAGAGRATPPSTRGLGVDGPVLHRLAIAAGALARTADRDAARRFFEEHFRPHRVAAPGFVTGYFEPELPASRAPSADFPVPLYRRPPELVEVSDGERPPDLDPDVRFARRTASGLEPFFDRAAIETGALAGRGLELAWLRDPIDAFFVHVQGSARLRLIDGGTLRVAFDGKSGHPYTSIGRLVVERGLLSREEAHKDGLEAWLRLHPEDGSILMRENRSFIFFREVDLRDDEGPLGAAGVALTAGRSLAVDRTLHTFGTPIWVEAPAVPDFAEPERPLRRLMVAQDTGSGIVGPARGDLFFGSGAAAGSAAGRVRHAATFIALLPDQAAGPQ